MGLEQKIAEHYNKSHGGQQQQPAQQAPPPQQQPQQPAPAPEQKHHGSGLLGKLGNAAIFGAGATAGSDAINGLLGR